MKKIVKVLMERDGMSETDAVNYYNDEMNCVREYIFKGDYNGAEDYFQDVFSLEPDFLLNAIF